MAKSTGEILYNEDSKTVIGHLENNSNLLHHIPVIPQLVLVKELVITKVATLCGEIMIARNIGEYEYTHIPPCAVCYFRYMQTIKRSQNGNS